MHKCNKCGHEFAEDFIYCPNCGEKLDKNITCKTCGNIISKDANFCGYCGTKINDRKYCSKCNAELDELSNFCVSCGEKVVDKKTSYPKKTNNIAKKYNHNFVLQIVLIVLSSLLVLGVFLPFISQTAIHNNSREQISIFDFFSADYFEDLGDLFKVTNDIPVWLVLGTIFPLIYIVIGIVFVFTFGIKSIVKNSRALYEKDNKYYVKHFIVATIFYFSYILLVAVALAGLIKNDGVYQKLSLFPVFMLILFVLFFAADKVMKILFVERKINPFLIVSNALKLLTIIFTIIITIKLCGSVCKFEGQNISTMVLLALDFELYGSTFYSTIMLHFINLIIVVLFVCILMKKLANEDRKSVLMLTILELLVIIIYLFTSQFIARDLLLSYNSDINIRLNVGISTELIIALVLAILQLGVGITQHVFVVKSKY